MIVCCGVGIILEVTVARLFVFHEALPLICGVAVNRQLFVEEDALGLFADDDACCDPLADDIPDEL